MDLIAIGTVRTSWGLDGWVKLTSYSGEWDHFRSLETVELRRRDGGSGRIYEIEGFRMHHGGGLLKLRGVDSPEAGKALAGMDLLVDRRNAAELAADEWYLSDLVGLDVVSVTGGRIGTLVGILESSDDLLEIEKPEGKRFLVPFRSEFVGEPDLVAGTIVLTAEWLGDDA